MKTDLTIALIPYDQMETILPLVIQLNQGKIAEAVLKSRLKDMLAMGGYQCIGVYDAQKLIGVCGFWVLNKLYAGTAMLTMKRVRNSGSDKDLSH